MAPFFFDPANAIVFNPFTPDGGFAIDGFGGSPNVTMVPDPGTFTVLPWAPKTALVFCDLYLANGVPFPLAPRTSCAQSLDRSWRRPGPTSRRAASRWSGTSPGLSTTSCLGFPRRARDAGRPARGRARRARLQLPALEHLDEIDHALRADPRRRSRDGLPLRSFDDEWAPSQVETTFDVLDGLAAADCRALFRRP